MNSAVQQFPSGKKFWNCSISPANEKIFVYALLWFFFGLASSLHSRNFPDLIFVQIPSQDQSVAHTKQMLRTPVDRYIAGARIVKLLSSASVPENLTPEFYAACDPDVSFDGRTIIFSGKEESGDYWQIWQMNTDGSEKLQMTYRQGNCITPLFAGNRFYLDDPQPTPQIIYAGTEHGWVNFQEPEQVFSLYGADPAGKSFHRLTFNLHSDYSPHVLPNGQIIFISWQINDIASLPEGHFALLAVNNDGTDFMPYYGNHEKPIYKDMIAISDFDDRVYFIESDSMVWLGGGDIAFISQRRPLHSYQKLTHSDKGIFHSPCPLPKGELLISYRPNSPHSNFGIFRIDGQSGKLGKQVFNEQGWHSIDTQILSKHPAARGHSNWLIPGTKHGVFYCLNSYLTNLPDLENPTEGAIKYIRVLEGIPGRPGVNPPDLLFQQNQERSVIPYSVMPSDPKRILGVAPVEEDGSFQIKVPAETPLNFQLLDENYLAIRPQQAWTWVMGNESRGCIGCHEDPELSPPNILVKAVTRPASDLMVPTEQRRMVDFRNHIAPLIESKCSTIHCHVPGQAMINLKTISSSTSDVASQQIYETLLNPMTDRPNERYVIPGKAKESPLIWHLFGKRLGVDETVYSKEIKLMPPDQSLKAEERLLFIEWIDLGVAWDHQSMIESDKQQ